MRQDEIAARLAADMNIVGLTGGSGTGKTTALNVLRGMGAVCIDADELYHTITRTSQEMKREIISRFGEVYDGDTLNRKQLGNVVFSDPAALADLNAITHKYVSSETNRILREAAMTASRWPPWTPSASSRAASTSFAPLCSA